MYNSQQEFIINEAVNWYNNSSEQIFQYSGGPGTGKTFILYEILKRLKIKDFSKVAPMAYTGAAAIVMRSNGMMNASTIHSWLYEPVETIITDQFGKPIIDPYYNKPLTELSFIPKDLYGIKLMIIDEGYMVPLSMRNEILSREIKIIVSGDVDQLPPVGEEPAFLVSGKIYYLTQVMRQSSNSTIVPFSKMLLEGKSLPYGVYSDVMVIDEDELTDIMIKGTNILLCGKNNTREYYNKYFRETLLNIKTNLPLSGERMVCRKNNRKIEAGGINIANGLFGLVYGDPDLSNFNGKDWVMNFKPNLIDTVFYDLKCDFKYLMADTKQRKFLKNSKYSRAEKFEFGYASTVHLAQGSQYYNGIYCEEYLGGDIMKSLNYTALTRFTNLCIYVKKKKKFYNMYN